MYSLYNLAKPLIFKLDAEKAHELALNTLRTGLLPKTKNNKYDSLKFTLWNRSFPNPIGLAAGFDKNAEALHALFNLGFGFIEAGTVTPKPQEGNPKPRIFRSPKNEAIINRMGFPNVGIHKFKENLEKFMNHKPRSHGMLGINIGMNKDQTEPEKDYAYLVKQVAAFADYLTINISSPNTPGLRNLQV